MQVSFPDVYIRVASGSLTFVNSGVGSSLVALITYLHSMFMQKKDWLMLVAVHSDTWLYAVAFYNGARLNKDGR